MKRFRTVAGSQLIIQQGDITKLKTDAIVNSANRRLLGGMGVDEAIHLWAGPELEEACRQLPEVEPEVRCPTGEARVTPGFLLPAKYVIHAVGPVFESLSDSGPILRKTYRSTLLLAQEYGLRTIAFPAISCGIFCFPVHDAAKIALSACVEFAGDLEEIHFVLFTKEHYQIWLAQARTLLN